MASEPAAKRARRTGDEEEVVQSMMALARGPTLREAGRVRVAEEIAAAKARGATGAELSEIYKRGYEQQKAETEKEVAGILAGLADEIKARLQKENVSLEVCEDLITPQNVKIVADILDVMGPLGPVGGRRHRRRHMRGGALRDDIYAFFAALCALPREVAGRVSDAAGAALRGVAARLTDEATVDRMTQLALQAPKVSLAILAGADLRRDESLITRVVTTILQTLGDTLTPTDIAASIGTFGLNVSRMAGSAGWPLVTLATLLITRYAAREAWTKAYDAADRVIRAEMDRGVAMDARLQAARTYALAVQTFLTNLGRGMKARIDAYMANREAAVAAQLDLELEEYMAAARRIRQQRQRQAVLERALPALEDAAAGHGEGGRGEGAAGAAGREGGRRRTRKHRVHRRRTHKKRFHRM